MVISLAECKNNISKIYGSKGCPGMIYFISKPDKGLPEYLKKIDVKTCKN